QAPTNIAQPQRLLHGCGMPRRIVRVRRMKSSKCTNLVLPQMRRSEGFTAAIRQVKAVATRSSHFLRHADEKSFTSSQSAKYLKSKNKCFRHVLFWGSDAPELRRHAPKLCIEA
ncbi:MAG: hypothetical protein RR882_17115, partial [Comamonas sp.]